MVVKSGPASGSWPQRSFAIDVSSILAVLENMFHESKGSIMVKI